MTTSADGYIHLKPNQGGTLTLKTVAIVIALMACALGFFVWAGVQDENKRMLQEVENRAKSLIFAAEGGARYIMLSPGRHNPVQQIFIEEVSRQPNILYLSICGDDGIIFAHTDPQKNGTSIFDKSYIRQLTSNDSLLTRTLEHGAVVEVSKKFSPLFAVLQPPVRHNEHNRNRWESFEKRELRPMYITVGIDASDFLASKDSRVNRLLVIALLILLVASSFSFLLFYIQHSRASRRLLQNIQYLSLQVFENLPIGIFATDKSGRVILHNKFAEESLNMHPREGKEHIRFFESGAWQKLAADFDSGKAVQDVEELVTLPNGKKFPVNVSLSRLSRENGEWLGYLYIVRDVKELKQLQEQIRLNERLTALGNMAAGVAHEIRNPLSSIKGFATILGARFTAEDKYKKTADMLIDEVERLNRVVSGLLGVAKAGEVQLAPLELIPLLKRAVDLVQAEAQAKHITIVLDVPEQVTLLADGDKLLRAVINLLTNALQATPEQGQVSLKTVARHDGVTNSVNITVTDTGCGMDKETLGKIFTPYFTTKASGTGLGLTITYQIIEQHSGKITVSSESGSGTSFCISLPLSE